MRTKLTLQWIPSHSGAPGKQVADILSKAGSRLDQHIHPLPYEEAKAILKSKFRTDWRT